MTLASLQKTLLDLEVHKDTKVVVKTPAATEVEVFKITYDMPNNKLILLTQSI